MNAKEYLADVKRIQEKASVPKSESRMTITPAEDIALGVNEAGEPLYESTHGRYRMHYGKPDFGGDLVPRKRK